MGFIFLALSLVGLSWEPRLTRGLRMIIELDAARGMPRIGKNSFYDNEL
jgi:hypothetical protein